MLTLLIVGLILLVIGYVAPIPAPGRTILIILGWIAVIIGGVVLAVELINTAAIHT